MNISSNENGVQFSLISINYTSSDNHAYSTQYCIDTLTYLLVWRKRIFDFNLQDEIKSETNSNHIGVIKMINLDDLGLFIHNPLKIPTMMRCQNCETNYSTKYQYQRHQCKFNAEKVVLKPNVYLPNVENNSNNQDNESNRRSKTKYECNVCNKQFVSITNLERHRSSHENPQDNICDYCNKRFVSENRLRIHKENHCKKAGDLLKFYRTDITVWKCCKCQQVFSSDEIVNNHYESCNSEFFDIPTTKTENEKIEKISTEILLQCEFCNRTYADKNILLKHQKTHSTDRNYECAICKEIFDSYITATQHWLKKCSENTNSFPLPKLIYCEYCDRTFKSHELLYSHKIKKKHYTQKIHVNNDEINSNSTKQTIKNEFTINKLIEDVLIALEIPLNQKINNSNNNNNNNNSNDNKEIIKIKNEPEEDTNGDKTIEKRKRGRKRKLTHQQSSENKTIRLENGLVYQCERCVQIFTTTTDLETHHKQEHAATFNCDECSQVLHSARALLIHSRAHKNLKPFMCEICGKSYSQTSHLWQHMRFHQGIKPFACPHEGCEARYTIRPDLKDHIRKVHTRERPFKCNVCGKCFLTGSVYYQHRLIHTGDRRYGCDMCDRRFFRADALNNHKRIHTNERPYPCFVCGRLFRQKGDCNKHCRTQHPDAIHN